MSSLSHLKKLFFQTFLTCLACWRLSQRPNVNWPEQNHWSFSSHHKGHKLEKQHGQNGIDYLSSKLDSHENPRQPKWRSKSSVLKVSLRVRKANQVTNMQWKPTCFSCSAPRHSLFICNACNKLDVAAYEKLVFITMRSFSIFWTGTEV